MPLMSINNNMTVIALMALAIVYFYLYTRERKRSLGFWAAGWAVFCFGTAMAPLLHNSIVLEKMAVYQGLNLLCSLLIISGTCSFLDRKFSKCWIYCFILFFVWLAAGVTANFSVLVFNLPVTAFLCWAFIWTGSVFLRSRELEGPVKFIIGCALILWGCVWGVRFVLHHTGNTALYASWGDLVSPLLALVIAFGIILVYFDKSKSDLIKSEKIYRLLAENARDLIYRYRLAPEPGFEYVSPSSTAMTGYTPEEHYLNPHLGLEIIHNDDRPVLENAIKKVAEITKPVRLRWIRKDGGVIWTDQTNVPVYDDKGSLVAIEGIVRDITDQVAVGEELRRYQVMFDHVSDIILFVRNDGQILDANNAAASAYGYSREELVSMRIDDLRVPGDLERIHEQMRQADLQGIVFETDHRRRDGSAFPVEVSSKGVNIGGSPVLMNILRDITDRRRAEEIILFERSQLLSIFNSINEIIYVVDTETHKILYANHALRNLFKGGPVGKDCYKVLQGVDSPCEFCTIGIIKSIKSGGPWQRECFNRLLNRHFIVTDRIIKWPDGRDVLFSLSIDVTGRKIAEEALRESEKRFRILYEDAPLGYQSLDGDGNILEVNSAWLELLGYSKEEVVGRWFGDFLTLGHREHFIRNFSLYKKNGSVSGMEFEMIRKDGSLLPVSYYGKISLDERGHFKQTYCILHDIIERNSIQRDLREAKDAAEAASSAKSQFLANMSHEIRTPMSGIIGAAELLMDTAINKEQYELIKTVSESARSLLEIVDDILDFSRIEAGKMKLDRVFFSPADVIQSIVELLSIKARKKGLALSTFIDPAIPNPLRGDPGRIRQVILNLVGNAVKFTEKGEVMVKAVLESPGQDYVTLRFEIEDTGIGLQGDSEKYIFEPFVQVDGSTTRKYGGTGLGLAISKQLVELMGGSIGVKSEAGKGSSFWFTVTIENGGLIDTARPRSASGIILLAENNPVIQKLIIRQLNILGHDARAVDNGMDALSEVLSGEPYSLILLDCQMPVMDGYEVAKNIRKHEASLERRVPIIALTGSSMEWEREQCLAAGMDDSLIKPVRLIDLSKALERWINRFE